MFEEIRTESMHGQRRKGQPAWKRQIKLKRGQTLRLAGQVDSGTLGQRDVECYDVIDSAGHLAGSVVYSEVTSLKPPFRCTSRLLQLDKDGKTLVDERW